MRTVVLAALLVTTANAPATEVPLRGTPQPGIENQFIVVFDRDVIPLRDFRIAEVAHELADKFDIEILGIYDYAIGGFYFRGPELAARAISQFSFVREVWYDQIVTANQTQPNPDWGLDRIDQRSLPLNQMFTYSHSGAGVRVYVLDSGIRTTHVDFGGRAFNRIDFTGGNGEDCRGHGTRVAGLIAGATWGAAKDAEVHSVRVLNCHGSGVMGSVGLGLNWVANELANNPSIVAVVNMSLSSSTAGTHEQGVQDIIDIGVQVVTSAANENDDACNFSPVNADAIVVGSVDQADTRASNSNYGNCVDVFAPGVGLTSVDPFSDTGSVGFSGTSAAAPLVSARIAQILSKYQVRISPSILKSKVAHYQASQNRVKNAGAGSPTRLLYSHSEKYPLELMVWFTECIGDAQYDVYTFADYGPETEVYTREIQYGGSSTWSFISSNASTWWPLFVSSGTEFRVRARYSTAAGDSEYIVSGWHIAPWCW